MGVHIAQEASTVVKHPRPTRVIQPKILYFGTPVVLLTTLNADRTSNITPMSSAWALGDCVVLGLAEGGKALENLDRVGECVINLPDAPMWRAVEALAPYTGKDPVPASKQQMFQFRKDKFAAAALTPLESSRVRPARIAQCPLSLEAVVKSVHRTAGLVDFAVVETQVLLVHAAEELVRDAQHIDPAQWRPLIYNFRHYFGLGEELGKTFRAEL